MAKSKTPAPLTGGYIAPIAGTAGAAIRGFGAICLAGLALAFADAVATPAASDGADRPARASVLIEHDGGHGTGVVIASGRVLTAAHVVQGHDKLTVTLAGGRKVPATVLWATAKGSAEAPAHDVALLAADTGLVAPAVVSCDAPRAGAPIVVYGNPLKLRNIATRGYIASAEIRTVHDMLAVTALDVTAVPGNSGGGVWNDRGEVVGLVNAVAATQAPGFLPISIPVPLAVMTPGQTLCQLLGR